MSTFDSFSFIGYLLFSLTPLEFTFLSLIVVRLNVSVLLSKFSCFFHSEKFAIVLNNPPSFSFSAVVKFIIRVFISAITFCPYHCLSESF